MNKVVGPHTSRVLPHLPSLPSAGTGLAASPAQKAPAACHTAGV